MTKFVGSRRQAMRHWLGPLCLALLMLAGVRADARNPVLVPDVSSRTIDIKYSFTGETLLLFGAIIYPDGRLADDRADIVVVIQGPTEPIILREKRRIGGIWVNADNIRFASAPGYYAVASSRPIADMLNERTAAVYEIGLDNLSLSPAGFTSDDQLGRFERGLVDLKRRLGLYVADANAVEITQGSLYRARLNIPARVPVGRYTAETFLVRNGEVIAVASRQIDIRKTGTDRFIANAAQNHGLLYGLFAVFLSVGMGWAAATLFARR